MNNLAVLLATAALYAALLAGCASGAPGATGESGSGAAPGQGIASGIAQSPPPMGVAATEETALAGSGAAGGVLPGQATGEAGRTAYSPDAFADALDKCVGYHLDTAGGSLKTAMAAAALTEFLATQCHPNDLPALVADAGDWYAELNADQRQALAQNWGSILQEAQAIAADPASQQALLGEAGVSTDFSALPLQDVPALLTGLDGILKTAT